MILLLLWLSLSNQQDILAKAKQLEIEKGKLEAIEYLHEFLLRSTIEDNLLNGKINLRLAYLYGNQHQLKVAKSYYKKALEIGKKLEDNGLKSQALLGLGAILQIESYDLENPIRKLDSTLIYYAEALPALKEEKDSINISGLYTNVGLVMKSMGKLDSAKFYLEKSFINRFKIHDARGIVESTNNMGQLNFSLQKYEEAQAFFEEAIILAKSSRLLDQQVKSTKNLAKVLSKRNKKTRAIEKFEEYDSLNSIYQDSTFIASITELDKKYKTAEIEKDNALKQSEIDKNKRQIILLTIILFSILIITVIGFLFVRQRRKLAKAASEQQINDLLQQQEIKTAYALLEGQDQERKRIASELHDNLGSILTSLNMFSDAMQTKEDPQQMAHIADKISETSLLANEEVRKISHSLDSGLLKHFGLKTAITHLMEAVGSSKEITIETELQIEEDLKNETSLEIYRIVQELVNNTLKHAKCTKVRLDISHVDQEITLIFQDNGVGFDLEKVEKGLGLKNLDKRTKKLDGELSIESQLEKGSTFIIEIPTT